MRALHCTLPALALLAVVSPAYAAQLTVIGQSSSHVRWINGEQVDSFSPMALPEFNIVSTGASASIEDCEEVEGCSAAAAASSIINFQVDPEPGEQVGQRVTYCAVWTGSVQAQADQDASAGAVAGGEGSEVIFPVEIPVQFSSAPARLTVNATDEYIFGELLVTAPPAASDAQEVRRVIHVRIGDTIEMAATSLAAAATPESGDASASASSRLELELCHAPIPANDGRAMLALAALLGLGGLWAMRRRARVLG